MKNLFKNIFYLCLALSLLSACQSVKDGLTGKKQNNQDEFLVEKKNPLVLPPDFDLLPMPKTSSTTINAEEEIDLESIITKKTGSTNTIVESNTSSSSVEKSILEKIKSN